MGAILEKAVMIQVENSTKLTQRKGQEEKAVQLHAFQGCLESHDDKSKMDSVQWNSFSILCMLNSL